MSSFFEKLKKGMEIEELPEKEVAEEEKKPPKKKKRKPSFAKALEGKEKEKKFEIKVKEEPDVALPAAGAMAGEKEKAEKKWLRPEGQLTVDVYQTDKDLVIQSAIAGIEPEDLDISIENDAVIIKGNREKPFEEEKNYFYQECYWGRFSRKIILPVEVDASKTQASIKKGILTIRIPKIEREKKRKITVEE